MEKMVRKQVYIEAGQEASLKRRAKDLGVSESDLIRQGIDRVVVHPSTAHADTRAWEEELAFIRARAKTSSSGEKRTWRREDLYEDRLKPLSR